MSVHPYVPHTLCSIEFRACTLQRSFDDWPTCGLIPCRASDLSVHLKCTTGYPTTLHGLRTLPTCGHAVVAQIHEVSTRVCFVFDRNPIGRHTADMPSATFGRVQKCCSLNTSTTEFQKPFHRFRFHSHHGSPSSRHVPAISNPMASRSLTNQSSMAQCKRLFNSVT